MNRKPCSLAALAVFATALLASGPARADGPFTQTWNPHAEPGQCVPIKGSKACERTDLVYTVNKADGSGTTKVSLIEDNTLSWSRISKMAKAMGEPFHPKTDSYQKKVLERTTWRGARLPGEGSTIEPPLYLYLFPVSDKVALIEPYDKSRTPETDKLYFVALDGKLDVPVGPGIQRNRLYYIGGYYAGMPAQVFELIGRDEARGTFTLRQYDGYGRERAVFDNIVLHKRKDNYDSYELSFYVNSQYEFVVSALHPDTGEPASLWFNADGSVSGYRPPAEVRSVLEVGAKDRTQSELLAIVGQLPVMTDLRDDRLYHPLNLSGEKIPAPDNFIGMARMFHTRSSNGDMSTAPNYYSGWLLVYGLETGYGYKVADRAMTSFNYPAMVSAEDVLASEASFKMLSGFGHSRVADGSLATIVRPFDRYEADGVTPAEGALPAQWHRVFTNSDGGLTLTASAEIPAKTYATSTEAFFAIGQDEIASDLEYARRQEEHRREWAALQAERDAEKARREAELQAYYAREAEIEAAYAAKRNEYRPKTGAEEFFERMEEYKRANSRPAGVQAPFKPQTTECYDQGDGTEMCFTR